MNALWDWPRAVKYLMQTEKYLITSSWYNYSSLSCCTTGCCLLTSSFDMVTLTLLGPEYVFGNLRIATGRCAYRMWKLHPPVFSYRETRMTSAQVLLWKHRIIIYLSVLWNYFTDFMFLYTVTTFRFRFNNMLNLAMKTVILILQYLIKIWLRHVSFKHFKLLRADRHETCTLVQVA